MIYENLNSFFEKPVQNFTEAGDITDFSGIAVALRCEYGEDDTLHSLLAKLLEQPGIEQLEALVFGVWMEDGEAFGVGPNPALGLLVARKEKLPNLKALFVGDIVSEENEISWIEQGDMSALWGAFPQLQHFRARGGNGLKLGKIVHDNLKTLIIETGGMSKTVVDDVLQSQAPLTHLELWLGEENYGATTSLSDFDALLEGRVFPDLKSLHLNNSSYQNEIAAAVAKSVVVGQLQRLGLSMGTLSDEGGQALLDSQHLGHLDQLDLTFHFLSGEMQSNLKAKYPNVILDDPQKPDELQGETLYYIAYTAVSE